NYFTVKSETTNAQIEAAFVQLAKRPEVGVILISQHIANRIRRAIEAHMSQKNGGIPTVIEMPSKDHPWDPEKDTVYRRARDLMGA
ncbi:uncharacterized protein TRIVIDRAFT_48653, partial [Trichoderma virens Gv29-8]